MRNDEVNTAFEMLLEAIEKVLSSLTRESELAIKNKDYKKAEELIKKAEIIDSIKQEVEKFQKKWNDIFIDKPPSKTPKAKNSKKLKKGLRTPENEFIIPILESLVELGGKAKAKDVLKKVEEKMKDKLNEYDLQGLPSNPSQKRWENAAQWCRITLVSKGLLSNNSPRGIWEITAEGIKYLEGHKHNK